MAAPVLVDLGRVHCLKAIEPEMPGQGFGVRIGCRYPPYLTATNGRLFEPVVNWIKRTEGEGSLECSLPRRVLAKQREPAHTSPMPMHCLG
jgi:hypothetical protein